MIVVHRSFDHIGVQKSLPSPSATSLFRFLSPLCPRFPFLFFLFFFYRTWFGFSTSRILHLVNKLCRPFNKQIKLKKKKKKKEKALPKIRNFIFAPRWIYIDGERETDDYVERTNERGWRTRRKEPHLRRTILANRYMGQWFSIIGSAGNPCVAAVHPYLTTGSWDVIVFDAPDHADDVLRQKYQTSNQNFLFFRGFSRPTAMIKIST